MISEEKIQDIFKPTNIKWKTSITKVESNQLITRGYRQENLIGNLAFTDMIYLLLKGNKPSKNESKMLEAVLVSFCDHGVTPPSTQTARIMASAGSPLNACLAGGLLAFGENHAGAIENSMQLLQDALRREKNISENKIMSIAEKIVIEYIKQGKKIPGFGHRYHDEDPRAPQIIDLAYKLNCFGPHIQLTLAIESILHESKNIRMNIDGVNAGILSDLGFDWRLGSGFFMMGRLPGLITHVFEEISRESPFRKFFQLAEIYYDGKEDK